LHAIAKAHFAQLLDAFALEQAELGMDIQCAQRLFANVGFFTDFYVIIRQFTF
jgi:hypothetical protein